MTHSSERSSRMLPPSLERLLSCAAIREGLDSLLLYDAPPELLERVAEVWSEKLAAVHGQPVGRVQLGPWTSEEDLWGLGDALPQVWRHPGVLATEAPRLVLIPDLTRLSLPGLRACVTLMGAEVVTIEREGQSRRFRPRFSWLAGCALSEVGQLSPHLLDRFALRIRAPVLEKDWAQELLRTLSEAPRPSDGALSRPEAQALAAAARVEARVTAEAREAAVAWLPAHPSQGHRGLLALARMACALVQLEHVERAGTHAPPLVQPEHVQRAARLLQLPAPAAEAQRRPSSPEVAPPLEEPPPARAATEAEASRPRESSGPVEAPAPRLEPAVLSPEEPQGAAALTPLEEEQKALVQREHAPLRLPFFQGRTSAQGRGPIVGVQPATDAQDLAIVGTLLAAAPYQRHRRKRARVPDKAGMLLVRSDLRSYRRAPARQHLLTLLLDFTSLGESDWQAALMPYLSQAYTDRAQICVIQVGARGAENELQAQRVLARNLLVPAVAEALDAKPGLASPLADGLELALATLRHALTVGRGAARSARLVVLTDGRGNIPLEASQTGTLVTPVGSRGVEDALRIAARLRGVRQLTSVVLKPQVTALRELPQRLSDALGAELLELPPSGQTEKGAPA